MQKLKNIQNFISPFFLSLLSLLKILIGSKKATKLPSTNHKTCVVLGNGPSLELSILEVKKELTKSDLICVNYFPLTKLFDELKPRFFVACDIVIWDKMLNTDLVKQSEKMFDKMNNSVDWPFYLFMPIIAKNEGDWENRISKNKNIKVLFYNVTPIEGIRRFNHVLFSKGYGMPRPHNVLIPALIHCINLNYQKVFLFGVDHSWLNDISIDGNNNVLVGQRHFYKENSTKDQMRKSHTQSMKLHEVLNTFVIAFKGYHEINKYAKSKGVSIINSTPDSFIDAFERNHFSL